MSATVVTFPTVADPVPLGPEAFVNWLDELADAECIPWSDLMSLLELVAAAQRDWTELVHQLGSNAITSVAARAAAASLEAILEQLRTRLTEYVNRTQP